MGTPLSQKLGIKLGHRVLLVDAPASFPALLEPLPGNVVLTTDDTRSFDIAILFAEAEIILRGAFQTALDHLPVNGAIWMAWPKKASKVPTDLSFKVVQGIGLEAGLVDNKVCAIDEVWSGVRMSVRLENRRRK